MRARIGLGVVVAVAALATSAADARRKKGRVVRVERAHTGTTRTLRICSSVQADGSAVCYGPQPEIGEHGIVVDDTGMHGIVQVSGVTPTLDSCGNSTGWNITSTVVSGDLSAVSGSGAVMFDYDVAQGGHVVVSATLPNPRSSEVQMMAYSNDGDDVPEIFESWYQCDLGGMERLWGTGQAGYYCLVYYGREGAAYREQRVDTVKNCY